MKRFRLREQRFTSAEGAGHWCSPGDARYRVLSVVLVLLGLSRCVRYLALFLVRASEKRTGDFVLVWWTFVRTCLEVAGKQSCSDGGRRVVEDDVGV